MPAFFWPRPYVLCVIIGPLFPTRLQPSNPDYHFMLGNVLNALSAQEAAEDPEGANDTDSDRMRWLSLAVRAYAEAAALRSNHVPYLRALGTPML